MSATAQEGAGSATSLDGSARPGTAPRPRLRRGLLARRLGGPDTGERGLPQPQRRSRRYQGNVCTRRGPGLRHRDQRLGGQGSRVSADHRQLSADLRGEHDHRHGDIDPRGRLQDGQAELHDPRPGHGDQSYADGPDHLIQWRKEGKLGDQLGIVPVNARIGLDLGARELRLLQADGRRLTHHAEVLLPEGAMVDGIPTALLTATVRSALDAGGFTAVRARVPIAETGTAFPPFRLPRLAGSELSRAVAFEGRRLVPMEAADVYFAWHPSPPAHRPPLHPLPPPRALI